jgi:uncharacterized linocin/CFP29 family protein
MNNLHRELAPISAAAWASIETEAKRTFTLHLAGRRVVDVTEPGEGVLSAVGTGHLIDIDSPTKDVFARARVARPVVEFRVPFTLSREAIDDVDRGAEDPDWQPVKDAARTIAMVEDRVVFDGYQAGSVEGLRPASSNAAVGLPEEPTRYPDVVASALTALRLAGVDGPYALVLSADAYTAVSETSDHGYPIRRHLANLIDGPIIWAPAIEGGLLVSTRGGDYELYLGQDLSIGYLSHDAATVTLYFEEALTFLVHTAEASVPLTS